MEFLVRKPGSGRPTHDEGDVFVTFEDGTCEKPGRDSVYWLIRMPGEHPELWETIITSSYEEIPVKEQLCIEEVQEKQTRMIHRRAFKFDFNKLPDYALQELEIKFICVLQPIDYQSLFGEK